MVPRATALGGVQGQSPWPYVRFTFQNNVNGEWITPVSLSLYAAGCDHCPSGMNGRLTNACSWICRAIACCAARSLVSRHFSRSASTFSSVGQPVLAAGPFVRIGYELPGFETVSPAQVTQNRFQPPWSI